MIKLQQETIYEMLTTEVSYIRQILTMTDVFMTSITILKSSERDGIFQDIDMEKLFSNIQDVLQGNLLFWKEILLPMKLKLEQTGLTMNPSDLKTGFLQVINLLHPSLPSPSLVHSSSISISNLIFIMFSIRKPVQNISNKNSHVMIYFSI